MTVQTSRSPDAAIRLAAAAHHAAAPRQAWLIVALLFLFMVINFADKAVIGIAAVPIMEELQLSPREFGLLGSSFFLLFCGLGDRHRLHRQSGPDALGAAGHGARLGT